MRYGDWDVLLFRTESRAPIKEFKVACHVINDPDFSQAQGSFGLPNVCCFVPSQDAGAMFHISVHSWEPPSISTVTRAYSKHTEDVKFEARLFIDGRLTASSYFERRSIWPHVIANSFHFSKNGDLEPLRFPLFRQELLQQNHWHPADEMGRIRIIISEGFPRDSTSLPFERVKNLVAFSFQHAPLDVLEHSGIAWPNPLMWQRHARASPMPVPTLHYSNPETHAHSPRRLAGSDSNMSAFGMTTLMTTPQCSTAAGPPDFSGQGSHGRTDFHTAPRSRQLTSIDESMDWIADMTLPNRLQQGPYDGKNTLRKGRMSTDESMPDFKPEDEFLKSASTSQLDEDCLFKNLKVPSILPTSSIDTSSLGVYDDPSFSLFHSNMSIPLELANSLTSSILSYPPPCSEQTHASHLPAPEIKSRKESRLPVGDSGSPPSNTSTASATSFEQQCDQPQRKVSQQMYIPSGESLPTTIAPLQTQNHQAGKSRNLSETAGRRSASVGEFGASTSSTTAISSVESALRKISGNRDTTSGKQHSKSASSSTKAIDESVPSRQTRHASPRIRLTPFVEDADDSP